MDLDQHTLSELYKTGRRLLDECGNYPSLSDDYKASVKKGTLILEDATRAVTSLDMFSRNEDLAEIPLENVKFLTLPYYLGHLTLRSESHTSTERLEILEAALIYFNDFISRVESYGIPTGSSPTSGNSSSNLDSLNAERNAKLSRLRKIRELESRSETLLREEGGESHKYWSVLLEKLSLESRDEIGMIEQEIPLAKLRIEQEVSGNKLEPPKPRRGGLKPVILCRDQVQKEVFGLGYPSLPTLTVAEFYEKRVNEGWYQCGMKKAEAEMGVNETEEQKAERQDREKDAHDEAALEKSRNWDEFKDDNPRGWGNRHNKG
ncbi:unnamed protein product [Notodromas monacha]|uniref:TAP42-like protein n=1 Tax=Notodromas monacha TaxID=399045 RepID=A0A7R9BGG4_9CRUS|nr:unnamed protein product [Notodromas monacha]CAG0915028.1 unnamed protein product [Notodromas monacha]